MFRGHVNDIDDGGIIHVKGYAFVGHKRPPNLQWKDYGKQFYNGNMKVYEAGHALQNQCLPKIAP